MRKKNREDLGDVYLHKLEREWRSSQKRHTDKELMEIFPEVKEIIPNKISELQKERQRITDTIKEKLSVIKNEELDNFSEWFWEKWIIVNEGLELIENDRHIKRLDQLLNISSGKKTKGHISEEEAQTALDFPIERLATVELKKSGKSLTGNCPLHSDRTPSFYIYPETNSFYCFGCKQGGNAINFIRLLYGYSFKEAVKFINNN